MIFSELRLTGWKHLHELHLLDSAFSIQLTIGFVFSETVLRKKGVSALKMLQFELLVCKCILLKINPSLRQGIPDQPHTRILISLKLCYWFHKQEAKCDSVPRTEELPPGDFLTSDEVNSFPKA